MLLLLLLLLLITAELPLEAYRDNILERSISNRSCYEIVCRSVLGGALASLLIVLLDAELPRVAGSNVSIIVIKVIN